MTALSIAQIVPCTEAEGPGKRFAIWFQGCPFRCPGCCNPEMLPFEGGKQVELGIVLDWIKDAKTQHDIEGITLLGGEPMAHAARGAQELVIEVKKLGLTVMMFTGLVLDTTSLRTDGIIVVQHLEKITKSESYASDYPPIHGLIRSCDIIVDGQYVKELPETERRWIGSSNQKIHFMSDNYHADDPRWKKKNTLELRLKDGEITINGFPAKDAKGLWKKLSLPTVTVTK